MFQQMISSRQKILMFVSTVMETHSMKAPPVLHWAIARQTLILLIFFTITAIKIQALMDHMAQALLVVLVVAPVEMSAMKPQFGLGTQLMFR